MVRPQVGKIAPYEEVLPERLVALSDCLVENQQVGTVVPLQK